MSIQKVADLQESLLTKVRAVSKTRGHLIRRVTDEEAGQIRALDGWQNGWFDGVNAAQVVLERRECGQHVIFRI